MIFAALGNFRGGGSAALSRALFGYRELFDLFWIYRISWHLSKFQVAEIDLPR
jgi:hypothetical protein